MKLNEVKLFSDITNIIRDGEFDTLGLNISENNMNTLTFLENEKYIDSMSKDITCVITTKEIYPKLSGNIGVVISNNPRDTFFTLHNNLAKNEQYIRKTEKTIIGEGCNISNLASIAKNNVKIGNNVTIEEFVVIRENTTIGDNVIIRAGAKIGGEGFEVKRKDYSTYSVIHLGGVVIGNNVEIQYNSCIDKAVYPWDNTIVEDYCKIDNLVHLGHACKIGRETLLAANSLIGGRTIIGEKCWVGISTTISNGLIIGNKCRMNIGSVVTRDIKDGGNVTGNFAIDHSKFIEHIKKIR